MAKVTWLVNREEVSKVREQTRPQSLGPRPDKYKEGLIQRPAPHLAHLEAARLGTGPRALTGDQLINWPVGVGRTRGLATGEIRGLRAPHSGYSEDHTYTHRLLGPPPSSFCSSFWKRQRCKKFSGFFQMNDATWVERHGNDSEHHLETLGRRKEGGLKRSYADSPSAFPLLLGPTTGQGQ